MHLRNARGNVGATKLHISGNYVFIIQGDYLHRVFKNESNEEILQAIEFGETKKRKAKEALLLFRKEVQSVTNC